MHGTQFKFQLVMKPEEKQAVPRKVRLSCSVIISNDINKPGQSGYSVLL